MARDPDEPDGFNGQSKKLIGGVNIDLRELAVPSVTSQGVIFRTMHVRTRDPRKNKEEFYHFRGSSDERPLV